MNPMSASFAGFDSLDDVEVRSTWRPAVGMGGVFDAELIKFDAGHNPHLDTPYVKFSYKLISPDDPEMDGKVLHGDEKLYAQDPDEPGLSDGIRKLRYNTRVTTRTSIYRALGLSPDQISTQEAAQQLAAEVEASPVPIRVNFMVTENARKPQYPYINDSIVARR